MTQLVSAARSGSVSVITIDNPPLNLLSTAVRIGLHEALRDAFAAPGVAAVVVRCTGRSFCAGFDITEFGQPLQSPTLRELVDQIEEGSKPVVAQLHGTVFGGGLELALACHARVAPPGTRLGLVEVKLGLLPGCGGTQRLPRAVGLEQAAEMTATGQAMLAYRAEAAGLLDAVNDDASTTAIELARSLATMPLPTRTSRRPVGHTPDWRATLDQLSRDLQAAHPGTLAPQRCLAAVAASQAGDFEAGARREWQLFTELLESPERPAQFHLFFAERQLARAARAGELAGYLLQPRTGLAWLDELLVLCAAQAGCPATPAQPLDAMNAAKRMSTLSECLWAPSDVESLWRHSATRARGPSLVIEQLARGVLSHAKAPSRGEHGIVDLRLSVSEDGVANADGSACEARLHILAQPVGRRLAELKVVEPPDLLHRAASHLLGACGFVVVPVQGSSGTWPSDTLREARAAGNAEYSHCARTLVSQGVLPSPDAADVLCTTVVGAARHSGGPFYESRLRTSAAAT